jgi:heme A synthase
MMRIAVTKRREARPIVRAAYVALGVVVIQLGVAAAMVELRLPPVLQSLHQVTGTLLWVAVFAFAALAGRALPDALGTAMASVPVPAGAAA